MNPSLWNDSRVIKMFYLCLIGLFLFLIGGFINELKTSAFIGSGTTATNTIVVSGTGDTYAAPDIATVSFSVTKEGATVATAQKLVDEKMNAAIVALKGMGIADKDIKLENNSFNPKYDYGTPCYGGMGIPCSQTSPKIIGYEATRSVVVKVRKLDNAGTVVTALGTLGATNLYGPTFSLDDEDAVNAAARADAIADAKKKAEQLAKDLGVHLVRIVNFSEGGSGGPIMYAKADMAMGAGTAPSAPAPVLPIGENHYVSNVTITYEIR